ncbi:GxxExxY protein [bacterium]|nr:GxxExxY protein [bacterium]
MFLENELTGKIIGAAIEVHRHLGPGLLESVYEECLAYELLEQGLQVERQLELPVLYKDKKLDVGFRIDLLVDQLVIVELKSVNQLEKIHEAQLLTYLRMAKKRFGLLMNFNVPVMKQGIRRLLND